jgi:hypothetical protein
MDVGGRVPRIHHYLHGGKKRDGAGKISEFYGIDSDAYPPEDGH